MASGVSDVDNLERTGVTLTVLQETDATNIVTTDGHDDVADFKLDEVQDLASVGVNADSVVGADLRVREADGATVMGSAEGVALLADLDGHDAAQLVGSFILVDLVDREAALGVPQKTEVLVGLLEGDDIHETGGVLHVSADLTVDLDETLHGDSLDFIIGQSVLETVAKHDGQRQALTELVRTSAGAGSPDTGELVKHPVAWRVHALHVFLGTTSHGVIKLDLFS